MSTLAKIAMSIIVTAATACCAMAQDQGVEQFVNRLLEQYPQARLLDIYKSCFQDYMGAEHLVSDTATVSAYLDRELAEVTLDDLQPWYYEPCGIEGRYVRVSLRAVKEGIISKESLLNAFIGSANDKNNRPDVECWATQWHQIVARIDSMSLDLPRYEQDKEYIEQVLSQGNYAISHSAAYRAAYSPHYRIVRRDLFERLGL